VSLIVAHSPAVWLFWQLSSKE